MIDLDEDIQPWCEVLNKENQPWDKDFNKKTYSVTEESQKNVSKALENENGDYSIFWTPDEAQKKMIDEMTPKLRKQMKKLGLKYNNKVSWKETIEITINWKKVLFPKKQPSLGIVQPKLEWDNNWKASMDAIKEVPWMVWVPKELFKELVKNLEGKDKAELLWIDFKKLYWSATDPWYGYFKDGNMYNNFKNYTINTQKYIYIYTLCMLDSE
jgi:hypothetical protein